MNRTALCIQMLQLLNSHKRMSVNELASILETNPRNIIEFKKELECAGYSINAFTGKYGGYELDKTKIIPSVNLTKEEKTAISSGIEYLRARNDFVNKQVFNVAISKILSGMVFNSQPIKIFDRFPLKLSQEEMQRRIKDLNFCIENKIKMEITYSTKQNKNKAYARVISPYLTYIYNGAWFVMAHDDYRDMVLYFKVNRITQWKILNEKFRIPLTYNEREYLDDFGMTKNSTLVDVKLKLKDKAMSIIDERIYGKNQTIENVSENELILSATMQGLEILAFILGFGSNCEILEPEWLRAQMVEEINNMKKIYEIN